jgi:hypothetical protein
MSKKYALTMFRSRVKLPLMVQDPFRPFILGLVKMLLTASVFVAILGALIFYLKVKFLGFARQKLRGGFAPAEHRESTFRAKPSPLTEVEQLLFTRLMKAMPEHIILAQVAYSQILYTAGASQNENFWTNATMKQKVADYVVLGPRFGIVCVIELDDSTHDPQKDAIRDGKVAEAGIKTVRFHVSRLPSNEEIRWKVLGLKASSDDQDISRWAPSSPPAGID